MIEIARLVRAQNVQRTNIIRLIMPYLAVDAVLAMLVL